MGFEMMKKDLLKPQGCKSGLVKRSETLQLMPKLHGCANKYAWSGSLCLESEEWSRFSVK